MELGKLKGLLGIPEEDASQDVSLQFILDDVEETVKNYCSLDDVPEGLINTAYRMAVDLYRYDRPGGEGGACHGGLHLGRGHVHRVCECSGGIERRHPEGLSGAAQPVQKDGVVG